MKKTVYLVARYIDKVEQYLDTTEPDTWTPNRMKALSSEDRSWIERLASRRDARVVAR